MADFGSNALDAYWMPFTPNRRFKANPRMVVNAKDMHYVTSDGRQVLDGTGGPRSSRLSADRPANWIMHPRSIWAIRSRFNLPPSYRP